MPRHPLNEEPSVEHIRELHEHIQKDSGWSWQRALDAELFDFYFDENAIPVPNTASRGRRRRFDPERMSTGEPARIIDQIISFFPDPPIFGAQFTGEGQHSEVVSEKVGQALNEAFDQANPPADSPWQDGIWQQALLGRRVDLVLSGDKYWYDFPFKQPGESEEAWRKRQASWRRKAPIPFLWLNLPAESTFPASIGTAEDEVLSTRQMTWSELADVFSEKELAGIEDAPKEANDRKWQDAVTLGIYSNRAFVAYVYLGEAKTGVPWFRQWPDKLLRVIEHGMDRCAIRILPGLTTGRREPPYFWRSVLYSSLGLLRQVDKLATRAATVAKLNAYPMMQEHLNQGSLEEQKGATANVKEFHEGDIRVYDAGDQQAGRGREGMSPIFQPDSGQEGRELLIWTLDRAGRLSGAVESLEGTFGPAGQAAWHRNFTAEMAKGRLLPYTTAVIGAGIDIAETISRAIISFNEPVVLARLDDGGQRRGDIELVPEELARYEPVLKGTYSPKIPINKRADLDLAVSLLVQSKQHGFVLDPELVYEGLMGVDDFWAGYQRWLELKFMLTDKVQAMQTQSIEERFEVELGERAGMPMSEFEAIAERIPEPMRSELRALAAGAEGAPGGNGAVSPQTRGAIRAGAPFSTPPPNPQSIPQVAP